MRSALQISNPILPLVSVILSEHLCCQAELLMAVYGHYRAFPNSEATQRYKNIVAGWSATARKKRTAKCRRSRRQPEWFKILSMLISSRPKHRIFLTNSYYIDTSCTDAKPIQYTFCVMECSRTIYTAAACFLKGMNQSINNYYIHSLNI